MHCIISYDIALTDSRQEIEQKILTVLGSHYYIRGLSNLYLVRVNDEQDWVSIHEALGALAKTSPKSFHFLMSPIIFRGRYDGWLPAERWADINKISNP